MKKKLLCSVSYLLFISMVFISATQAESPKEVYEAAESGLFKMLNSIPQGYELKYGFLNREEFEMATIGSPYQMYTIHPEIMKGDEAVTDEMIKSIEEWRFPVICNGQIRALLTVAKLKGKWQAVEIGAARLASELDVLEKGLSLETKDINRIIFRLYQIGTDFIVITESSVKVMEGSFYPVKLEEKDSVWLQDAQLKLSKLIPSTFQDLLPGLRDRYKNEYRP
jgi:hypothetical protein